MRFEIARTREMMNAGSPLALRLTARIALELRASCTESALEKIEQADYYVSGGGPSSPRPTEFLCPPARSERVTARNGSSHR